MLEPGRQRHHRLSTVARAVGGYRLDLADDQIDLAQFDALAAEARQAFRRGDPQAALGPLDTALACWRGPVLADADTVLRQHPAAVAAGTRRLDAALAYADASLAARVPERAVGVLRALGTGEPLHEVLHARLMLLLAATGEHSTALAAYAQVRQRLRDELGVEPGDDLRTAHLLVLRHEVGTAMPGPDSAAVVAPSDTPAGRPDGPSIRPAQLPLDVPGFVGRVAELARLDALTAVDHEGPAAVTISAVCGAGGVGKTALAVHWAHRVAPQFPDGQLFLNLRGFAPEMAPMQPGEAVGAMLDALGVPAARLPDGLDAQVGLYRSLLSGRRMLVILDNARDAEQVRPLLPGPPGCVVVVTSRGQLPGLVATAHAQPVLLDLLSHEEARTLLATRLGRRRVDAEPAAVDEVITRTARLPLALTIVAARAGIQPGLTLAALAEQLKDTGDRLDTLDTGDAVADVRAVFSWSYRTLSPAAARLFRLYGLHCGPDITSPALASLTAIQLRDAGHLLGELCRANLMTERTAGRYAAHDLLCAYAGELAGELDSEEQRQAAVHRLLDHYLHTARDADRLLHPYRDLVELAAPQRGSNPERLANPPAALAWLRAEHTVVVASVGLTVRAGLDTHAGQLARVLEHFLQRQGHWPDWVATQHLALRAAVRSGDRRAQAQAHHGFPRAYTRLTRLAEAQAAFSQALALFEEVGDRLGEGYVHLNLSTFFGYQGHHRDALRHSLRALDLFRAEGHRAGEANALNAVGTDTAETGDHQRALYLPAGAHIEPRAR